MTHPQPNAQSSPVIRQRPRPKPVSPPPVAEPIVASPSYEVGYGKPPLSRRFKQGQSGNPRGRPKGARGFKALVRDLMHEKVAVRTARGTAKISHIEAILRQQLALAAKGNPRALAQLVTFYRAAVPDVEDAIDQAPSMEALSEADNAILAMLAVDSAACPSEDEA